MLNQRQPRQTKIRIGAGHILSAAFILIFLCVSSFLRLLTLTPNELSPNENNNESTNGAVDRNSYHFVISSDCTSYQRWETLVQLHSARHIRQCGRYTWIVSGCLDDEHAEEGRGKGGANSDKLTQKLLLQEVRRHFPATTTSNNRTIAKEALLSSSSQEDECHTIHPHVHFTPDFMNMSVYGGPYADGTLKRTFVNRQGKTQHGNFGNKYPFNNKPNGLHHWITTHFLDSDDRRDEVIVLIDPDFLFMNKFVLEERVLPGRPAAAKYGLGAQFLDFNLTRICDRAPMTQQQQQLGSSTESSTSCPFVTVTSNDVNKYYSAGPPYVIHVEDVLPFSERWTKLVPPTYDEYPLLYAEMFAYSMAAVDLNLKHNLVKGLYAGCMTGWPHTHGSEELDALKLSANTYAALIEHSPLGLEAIGGGVSSCFLPPLSPPPFLHYCSRYSFGTPFTSDHTLYHWFAKRHVDHNILDCTEHHEPLQPYLSDTPEKVEGGNKDWNVLATCAIVRGINYAKSMGCEKEASNL